MEPKKQFVKNRFGISIVKCCASCSYKVEDCNGRLCTAGGGQVKPNYLCPNWEMRGSLENAGMGGGRVRTKRWLYYVNANTTQGGRLTKTQIERLAIIYELGRMGRRFINK